MTCAVAAIDLIADTMETLARDQFPGLCRKTAVKDSRLADILQSEANVLLELVDCVTCGYVRKYCDHHYYRQCFYIRDTEFGVDK